MEYQQPILDINGDKFRLDYAYDVLRLLDDPYKTIRFSEMERATADGYHRMRYDTIEKERYVIPDDIERLPQHIRYVEIPTKERLDLVAASRSLGYKDHEIYSYFFRENMIEKKARILPLLSLGGDDFFINARQGALVDSLCTINKIIIPPFQDQAAGIFSLRYVPETRNIESPGSPGPNGTVINIISPPLRDIDPEGWKILAEHSKEDNKLDTIRKRILDSTNRQNESKQYDRWRSKRR